MDFANCRIGGGVLRDGCVQEEILFMIYPELIVGRLFAEALDEDEALLMTGPERFNNYEGTLKGILIHLVRILNTDLVLR